MIKAAIILINYRDYAERFLAECRDSLRRLDYPKEKQQVFIVDNESSEGTKKFLTEIYPEAVVLTNEKNVGWGEGNNTAIRYAWDHGYEYFVLLNMDTVVEPGWLQELVAVAESDEKIGIAQSKILLYQPKGGQYLINSLGNLTHFLGFGFCDGYGELDRPLHQRTQGATKEIGYASGSSMLIKKMVFEMVGLFDPEFFMYHDDAEISFKARFAGYKIMLAQRSVVYHKYEFQRSTKQAYYLERNRLLMVFQMYRPGTILLLLPALLAMEAGLFLYAVASGLTQTKLSVWIYFLRPAVWRHILKERRRITKYRQITDREFAKYLVGTISFQEIYNPVVRYFVNPVFGVYWRIARRFIFW